MREATAGFRFRSIAHTFGPAWLRFSLAMTSPTCEDLVTVDYQLQRSDLVAISDNQRRFLPHSASRVYYFYVLPLHGAALAVVAKSLAIGALFSTLPTNARGNWSVAAHFFPGASRILGGGNPPTRITVAI